MLSVFKYADSMAVVVRKDGACVAQLYFDPVLQVKSVVLMPHATPEERLAAVRLSAYHAVHYVVTRAKTKRSTGGFSIPSGRSAFKPEKAKQLLSLERAEWELGDYSRPTLCGGLQAAGIPVVDAAYSTAMSALTTARDLAAKALRAAADDLYVTPRLQYGGDMGITGARFYSPHKPFVALQEDKTKVVGTATPLKVSRRTNELTDADVRSVYIRPPQDGNSSSMHFKYVRQPSVQGSGLLIELPTHFALSKEGPELLSTIVKAALQIDHRYLSVVRES